MGMFMGMHSFICILVHAHTFVCIHVDISGSNHKSAELENLWPVI